MIMSSIIREVQNNMPNNRPLDEFEVGAITIFVSIAIGLAIWFLCKLIVEASFRLGRLKRYVDGTVVRRSAFRVRLNSLLKRVGIRSYFKEYFIAECRDNSHLYYPVRVLYLLWVRHYEHQRDACVEAARYLYTRSERNDSQPRTDQDVANVYFNPQNTVTVTMVNEEAYREVTAPEALQDAVENETRTATAGELTVREGDPTAEDL